MASPGYGKRSTPGQQSSSAADFGHLTPREAEVAWFVERLPDGSDISVKALAKVLPYGQCALRTILNRLQRRGHLRRGSEHLVDRHGSRWVTRTWWSRAARDNDWWAAFASGSRRGAERRDTEQRDDTRRDTERCDDERPHGGAFSEAAGDNTPCDDTLRDCLPGDNASHDSLPHEGHTDGGHIDCGVPDGDPALGGLAVGGLAVGELAERAARFGGCHPDDDTFRDRTPPPAQRPARASSPYAPRGGRSYSPAYTVLVALGRSAPSVALSAADCAALEPLAAEWFARGATDEYILRALTDGLPATVHHPAGLIRGRLVAKLPPEPLPEPPTGAQPTMRLLECGKCGAPGYTDAMLDGECGACRGASGPARPPAALPPSRVHSLAAKARTAAARTRV